MNRVKLTVRQDLLNDRVRTAPLGLRGLARGSAASLLSRARRNRQDNSVNFSDDFRRVPDKVDDAAGSAERQTPNARRQTPHFKPQTLNPTPEALRTVQGSGLEFEPCTLKLQTVNLKP